MSAPSSAPPPTPLEMILSDRRSLLDTGLPPIVFVTVNAFAGLRPAAIAAVVLAALFIVERLVRRTPVMSAVGGLLGTGIAVAIALRSGSASGYFVPRAIQNGVLALILLGSIVIRRPLAAVLARAMQGHDGAWYELAPVRRAYAEATAAFAALFALRAVLYTVFILQSKTGLLATVALVFGWPAFAIVGFACYRLLPRRLARHGAPPRPVEPASPTDPAAPAGRSYS